MVGAEAANVATKRRGPAAVAETRAGAVRPYRTAVVAAGAGPVAAMAVADVAAAAGAAAGPVATVVAGPAAGAAEADSLFACPGCLLNRGAPVA